MKFEFVALDSDGEERRGMVEAPNRELANAQIKSYGLIPARVNAVKEGTRKLQKSRDGRVSVRGDAREQKSPLILELRLEERDWPFLRVSYPPCCKTDFR